MRHSKMLLVREPCQKDTKCVERTMSTFLCLWPLKHAHAIYESSRNEQLDEWKTEKKVSKIEDKITSAVYKNAIKMFNCKISDFTNIRFLSKAYHLRFSLRSVITLGNVLLKFVFHRFHWCHNSRQLLLQFTSGITIHEVVAVHLIIWYNRCILLSTLPFSVPSQWRRPKYHLE